MTVIYDLARAVEQATGLEGYDPQRSEPVSELIDPEGTPGGDESPTDDVPTRRWWAIGGS